MTNDKKQWTKPQLVVLTRGTPEESVLVGCKLSNNPSPGPNNLMQDGCSENPSNCGACQARSGS